MVGQISRPGRTYSYYQNQYDEVGNRLEARRGDLELDGWFNNLNQLTHLTWGGQLNIIGSVSTTNSYVLVQGLTNAPPFYPNPGTNWLGAATVTAGSNSIPIVASDGTSSNRTNLVVYMPSSNPQVFKYDLNGNLTSDGQRTYQWNAENRLTNIQTSAEAVAAGIEKRESSFTYDGLGRRAQKIDYSGWTGSAYSTTNITRFVWDGWLLLAELDAEDEITTYNVHGLDLSQSLQGAGGIGGLLCSVPSAGAAKCYTFDGNGNVTDVTDDTGDVVAHYEYSPFGRIVEQSGPFADANPWRFSTKYFEDSWGLYYYGHRFYSPEISRWLSRDPIGEEAFLSRYSAAKFAVCSGKNQRDYEACVYSVVDEIRALKEEAYAPRLYRFARNAPVDYSDALGLHCKILLMVGHWGGFVEDWPLSNPDWYRPCHRWGPMSCFTKDAMIQGIQTWQTGKWKIGGWPWFWGYLDPVGPLPPDAPYDSQVLATLAPQMHSAVLTEMQALCAGACCCKTIEVEVQCDLLPIGSTEPPGPGDWWKKYHSPSPVYYNFLYCGQTKIYTCPVSSL